MSNEQLAEKAYPLDGSKDILSEISVKDNRIGYAQALTDCQDFAEWCSLNGWKFHRGSRKWYNGIRNEHKGVYLQSADLFALFIQDRQSKTKEQ